VHGLTGTGKEGRHNQSSLACLVARVRACVRARMRTYLQWGMVGVNQMRTVERSSSTLTFSS
jgi:hypothetical protein